MKLIIAGKRDIYPQTDFLDEVINHFNIHNSQIVSGGATGVDAAAKYYCKSFYGEAISSKYKEFSANWDEHGKAAGPIRNKQMAEYGDALLLIWDGESRGSANMKKEMEKLNKPVYEVILKSPKLKEPEL